MTLTVIGDVSGGKPSGFDSAIAAVPEGCYLVADGKRALNMRAAQVALLRLSDAGAAGVGERLHHAEWTLTTDPGTVRRLGLMHDCAECRAGVDRAVARLAEFPEGEIAVGQLWWAP